MTEQDLINLGFKKENVSAEESGADAYHYYTYDLSDNDLNFCLISSANDEAKDDNWYVELFNFDTMRMYNTNDVELFIALIEKNSFTNRTRIANDNINVTNK